MRNEKQEVEAMVKDLVNAEPAFYARTNDVEKIQRNFSRAVSRYYRALCEIVDTEPERNRVWETLMKFQDLPAEMKEYLHRLRAKQGLPVIEKPLV